MIPKKTDSKLVKIWKTIRFACIALILLAISTAFLYIIVAGFVSLLNPEESAGYLFFGLAYGILVVVVFMFTTPYCFFVWGILLFLILMIIATSIGIAIAKDKKGTLKIIGICAIVIAIWFNLTVAMVALDFCAYCFGINLR